MEMSVIKISDVLDKARALLHHCYVKHLCWDIAKDNPSGIRICKANGCKIIADDYDSLSIWFIAVCDQETIACARICKRDTNGLLEIERYKNGSKLITPILIAKKNRNIVELNREAILSFCENKQTRLLILLRKIFSYCLSHHYSVLTTTNLDEWVAIYEYIAFPKLHGISMKYFDSDPSPVNVYFAESNDLKIMLEKIELALLTEKWSDVLIRLYDASRVDDD